jgi:peroxiredoxin
MVRTESTMVPLGSEAPDFRLPDTRPGREGQLVARDDYAAAPALVVMFLSNHCPYVKHIQQGLVAVARDYQARGVAFVAISSNDISTHPDDRPEAMTVEARQAGYPFAYVYDATQAVAHAYKAACTPDFFVYDRARRLVYRGQMDAARKFNQEPVDGRDLRAALDAVLAGGTPSAVQRPSLGCNIKWLAGNEPQ